ncbi:N-acetylmuramoyl-L-alanine amidase [Rhodospirillales bacterium TMPK1]|uniref:N-acetylmuramoyl-L-alanine amidase n=2 Tax=Roseiterribacter gracilis TaxID=2812848 RepID=A0A8S8XCH0_9PROT|nr:N-acetylmuramoyl-L-alanine amidase [Rhodospirillales bacterium TMPK1]
MLVLHYTGMRDAASALARLCDPASQVSAHYVVDEDGTIYRLVEETQRAWHAGVSQWRDIRDVNSRSIGIEIVNPGHDFAYHPFPAAQMAAVADLAHDILGRHPIPPRNVVGHSDIAPARKIDPGEKFDWRGLAAQKIGLFPLARETTSRSLLDLLAAYGYDVRDAAAAIGAFQRHFRTSRINGVEDAECRELAAALSKLAGLNYE